MNKKKSTLILVLFLLGIFMGAIDSGIISPARELIQNSFQVSRSVGTWMITLYTLVYAVSMPIVSKMADRSGYKKVYIFGIAMFGLGSLLCGLANFYGTFTFFLFARVIQAIGAGGIMPIANSVIGKSFPEEKRGTALGLVGAIYGVATILGPTMGSAILSAAGNNHWGWIFFINVPISIAIILLSFALEDSRSNERKPMDLAGSIIVAAVVGTLMYALTNLDFFNFGNSIKSGDVYPFIIASIIFLPILIIIESKAKDPVLNMKYFKNTQIVVVLVLAFIVGIGMMGMVFVPQFAENALKLKAGSGGYLVTLLAVFSGVVAPLSGILLDKKGAKLVLSLGFIFNIVGTLFLGFVATQQLSFITVLIGLAFMGFGVGFTMGAPLNYLILGAVPEEEGTTALATMSLIRSIGVTISPSIMIGFIVNAGSKVQQNIMAIFPANISAMSQGKGNGQIFSSLQSSDVTTIVDDLVKAIGQLNLGKYSEAAVKGINSARAAIESTFQTTMNNGYRSMFTAAAIIAAAGFIAALFLNGKKQSKQNL